MKLKKILAGLLAVVMVVSLLPAMLFAVSAEDPIKLPVSGYVYSPLNVNQPVENAFDTDESTFAEPYGKNKGTESAKNMYVGAQFPVSAEITSVHVKANGPDLKQYAEWNPVTTIQFSEDGKVWKTAYTFPSEDADIDATITSSQFSSDVTGMTINYARVSRAIDQDPDSDIVQGSGHTAYWHTMKVYDLAFYGSLSVTPSEYKLSCDDIEMNAETAKLKVKVDTSLGITSGIINLSYNDAAFSVENAENGQVTIEYSSVGADGTVAEVDFVPAENIAGTYSVKASGTAQTSSGKPVLFVESSIDIKVTGQQNGQYMTGEPVAINKTEGDTKPAAQSLWKGNAPVGDAADGVTFVFKTDGISEPVVANNFNIIFNGSTSAWNSWNWQTGGNNENIKPANLTFDKNGYTYLYVNRIPVGDYSFKSVNEFNIFTQPNDKDGSLMVNTNENATFQLLAIVGDNLAPTITFHNDDKSVITTYTYKYTDLSGKLWNAKGVSSGSLVSAGDIFAAAQAAAEEAEQELAAPTKAAEFDGKVTYEFKEWVDAEGNPVENVYLSQDVYASYTVNDTRPEYDIVFENEDGTVLQSTKVREGEKIEYKGETPKKASDDQYSYEFAGWSPALAEDATATAAATYTATYTQTERKYDVVFMDDDKQTKLGEVRVSLNGDAEAAFEEAYDLPTKAETDQYIYTFDKWVDADGAEVDLTKVAADMTVYASYKAEEKEGETPDPLAGIDNLIEEPITKNYNEEAVLFESEEGLLTGSEDYKQITIVFEVKGLNGGQLWLNGLYLEGNGNNCNNQGAPRQDANFQKSRLITKDGLYSIVVGVGYTDWQKNYFEKLTKVGLNVKGTYSASYAIGKDADALSAAWIAANPGKAYQQWIESLKSETERGTVTEYIKDGKVVEPETAPTITYQALYLGSYNQTIEYYSEKSNLLDTQNVTIKGGQSTALLNPVATVDSLYTGETPVKNSTMANTAYEFDGWQDAEGNIVSQVWDNIQLYPHFKFIDNRPIYTITLKNYDDTEFAKVEVRENDVIKYTGKNPKKPSTETNSYDFTGWNTALDGTGEALTEETVATGDAVYYAQYVETERRYDVTFMAEDKETELYEVRVDKNAAATIPEELIPEKEATAEYTYTFEKWVDAEGKEVDLSKVATDLVVYASYKATENKYTVTFMDDDKETKLDEVKVSFGGKAEVAEPTKEETNGYTYKFVQWVDAEGKPADLSKVEADMTVYAEWETTLVKFSDVEKGKWYYTAVDYAYSNGILAGMSQTEFGINNETTRAMLVAVLYRQEGSPSVEGIKNPFTDVPEKEYYYNAVLWAYDNEVVFGLTDTTFGPNEKITREQLAAILYRYAKDVKKYDVSYDTRLSLSVFEDKNDISSYAQEPIKFGMDKGYISGSKDNGILKMNPKKGTTRAEMASMVMRFLEAEHTPAK